MQALSIHSFLLRILLLVGFCWAQVTVEPKDIRLITNPPNIWTTPGHNTSDCGGFYWLDSPTQSVSLTFNGTRVAVNFVTSNRGRFAQIVLDAINVTQIDTASTGSCTPLVWTSEALAPGTHTVTVTALDQGVAAPPYSSYLLGIHNLNYTAAATVAQSSTTSAAASASTSSTGSTPSIKKPPNTGVIVGSVLGSVSGLLTLIAGLLFYRRKRSQGTPATVPPPAAPSPTPPPPPPPAQSEHSECEAPPGRKCSQDEPLTMRELATSIIPGAELVSIASRMFESAGSTYSGSGVEAPIVEGPPITKAAV